MQISINCPSYKRPQVETLDYIPQCKVWVCETEYERYKDCNPEGSNIIAMPKGIQGNISRVRNYILDHEMPHNDVVVIIDDDLKGIYRYNPLGAYGYTKHKLDAEELMVFIEKHTVMCQDIGFKLWGMNLNKDALNCKHSVPFNTKAIVLGPFTAHLKHDIRYDESIPLKEDYDLALQHLNKYRGILRLNQYHYNCKQSKQAGGCATMRNHEEEERQLRLLQDKWGRDIVRIDTGTKPKAKKERQHMDYNPIVRVPIKGV